MDTPPDSAGRNRHPVVAVCAWVGGLYTFAIGVGWLHVNPHDVHAPPAVFEALAVILALSGVLAAGWLPESGRINTVLGAMILTLMGGIGAWVAWCGDSQAFRGQAGIGGAEVALQSPGAARWAFGFGAAITLLCAAYAWVQAFKPRRPH